MTTQKTYYFAIRFSLENSSEPPSSQYVGLREMTSGESLMVSASLNKNTSRLCMFFSKAEFLEHLDLLDEEWARASKEEIEESL